MQEKTLQPLPIFPYIAGICVIVSCSQNLETRDTLCKLLNVPNGCRDYRGSL